ncbi:type II toxin-antitoxin system ParD family antitoxin, partial [Microvirga massiliensis]|uniref:type II toxin-antitoxin system ParD family antitoxin n=1 Tax=Microvirga massiliensis TaxID=1033741 RepID=UPI000B2CCD1A
MPSKSALSVSLTPELTALVATKVASGRYRSASEVVRAGLRALEKEEHHLLKRDETPACNLDFLDDSETGRLTRVYEWSRTSIGPLSSWPQSLKTTVGLLLRSPVPIVLLWGPDGVMIYNDAYSDFAGGRHPRLFGSKVREGWPEVADFNDHVMKVGLSGGTLSYRDQELTLYRNGVPEPVWMNLDYSPVLDESGQPAGVLAVVVETTERVLAERALAKAEERLSFALDASGMVGTFDWHIPSDTFYSDPRFAAMFSVNPEKGGAGTPIADYMAGIHPDDRGRVAEAVNHTIATGQKYVQEYRLLQKDGTVRWIEARGECLYDDEGKPLRFPGAVVDITEHKRAEEVERQLAAIITSSNDAIVSINLDCTITSWNEGAERLYGHRAEEVIGKPVTILLPDDRKDEELEIIERICRGERVEHYETIRQRKDGSLVEISLTVSPVRDAQGSVVGASKIARDITEHRRVEEALRESQRHLNAVLNNASVAVLRMDERQQCVYMNPAAEKLTGYSLAEVRGRALHDVIHHTRPDGSHYPLEECPIDRAFPEAHQMQGEEIFVHRDGSFYPVAFTASPIQGEDGKPIGTIIEARDIRSEKEAQERQRLLLRELIHRVKNIFAITSGMVSVSARSARTPQEMAQILRGRLDALVRAN